MDCGWVEEGQHDVGQGAGGRFFDYSLHIPCRVCVCVRACVCAKDTDLSSTLADPLEVVLRRADLFMTVIVIGQLGCA